MFINSHYIEVALYLEEEESASCIIEILAVYHKVNGSVSWYKMNQVVLRFYVIMQNRNKFKN
jgi:hypothetical protein